MWPVAQVASNVSIEYSQDTASIASKDSSPAASIHFENDREVLQVCHSTPSGLASPLMHLLQLSPTFRSVYACVLLQDASALLAASIEDEALANQTAQSVLETSDVHSVTASEVTSVNAGQGAHV